MGVKNNIFTDGSLTIGDSLELKSGILTAPQFYFTSDGFNNLAVIDSDAKLSVQGGAYFGDNVGIGTTKPDQALHLYRTNDVAILLETSAIYTTGFKSSTAVGDYYNNWSYPDMFILKMDSAFSPFNDDQQDFYDFSFNFPSGASIDGIEAKLVMCRAGHWVLSLFIFRMEPSYNYYTDFAGESFGGSWFEPHIYEAGIYEFGDFEAIDGVYNLKVREVIPESDFFDEAKLVLVDVPEGYGVLNPWSYTYSLKQRRPRSL